MYELALFAGAGGGLLATTYLLKWRTVCYVERDRYCVEVLKARIGDDLLHDAPVWSDVRSFTKHNNQCRRFIRQLQRVRRDLVVTAGFPCQPFSIAGSRLSDQDERNMWPDTIRVIREIRPRWALLENVPNLLSGSHGYFGQVLKDLAESGYNARWDCVPASAIGANHQRDRLFIIARDAVAYAQRNGREQSPENLRKRKPIPTRGCQALAHANDKRQSLYESGQQREILGRPNVVGKGWWQVEPQLGRMADGVAHRVDRLRAIGNGQIPAVVEAVWLSMAAFGDFRLE